MSVHLDTLKRWRKEAFDDYYQQPRLTPMSGYAKGTAWGTLATLDKVIDLVTDGAERKGRAIRYMALDEAKRVQRRCRR